MTVKTGTDAAAYTAAAMGFVTFFVGIALFNAFVLQVMWQWFVVPFGMPPIGLAHAYGVLLLWSLFRPISKNKDEGMKWVWQRIATNLFVLLLGWIAQGFM